MNVRGRVTEFPADFLPQPYVYQKVGTRAGNSVTLRYLNDAVDASIPQPIKGNRSY